MIQKHAKDNYNRIILCTNYFSFLNSVSWNEGIVSDGLYEKCQGVVRLFQNDPSKIFTQQFFDPVLFRIITYIVDDNVIILVHGKSAVSNRVGFLFG